MYKLFQSKIMNVCFFSLQNSSMWIGNCGFSGAKITTDIERRRGTSREGNREYKTRQQATTYRSSRRELRFSDAITVIDHIEDRELTSHK